MKQLDFNECYNEIKEILEKEKSIVLCTSNGDKVSARTVFFAFYKDCIYFVTSKAYSKCKQIEKNPNVALCLLNLQVEGIALFIGHPKSDENKEIYNKCLKNCPEMDHYCKYKNTVLIEININKIGMWKKGREYIDLNKKNAYRIG